MADTPPPPKDERREDPTQEPAVTTVSGMSNDSTTAATPVTVPVTQKPPVKMGPDGKPLPPQQEEPQADSRFVANPTMAAMKDQLGMKTIDPHLQEMLAAARIQKTKDKERDGFMIGLDKDHAIFAGSINGKDVIGTTDGKKVDAVSAKAMVAMAKSRGWKTVYCTLMSEQSEKEALWLESKRQGLEMGNFAPKPDSDVAKQWLEEQKRGASTEAKLTQADPGVDPKLTQSHPEDRQVDTLRLLRAKADAVTTDPALKDGLNKMFEKVSNGSLAIDTNKFNALSEALSDKHTGREGFNLAADILNKADPSLKIAAIDPAPPEDRGTRVIGPRVAQNRAPA